MVFFEAISLTEEGGEEEEVRYVDLEKAKPEVRSYPVTIFWSIWGQKKEKEKKCQRLRDMAQEEKQEINLDGIWLLLNNFRNQVLSSFAFVDKIGCLGLQPHK